MKYIIPAIMISLCFFSCQEEAVKNEDLVIPNKPVMQEESYAPLQDVLNEKKASFNEKATEEKKKLYAEGIEDIVIKGVLDKAKKVGDRAPLFSLQNAIGNEINLASYLEKGPVVLTWYRGGWCPYCNLTLARMQEELPNFKAEGASLIALTPEVPDSSISTSEKLALEFEVLSDLNNHVARQYGIVFELIPGVAEAYQNAFGLHQYNGDESNELPLAATYVINTDGTIAFAFVDADYRNRAEPKAIVDALRSLK